MKGQRERLRLLLLCVVFLGLANVIITNPSKLSGATNSLQNVPIQFLVLQDAAPWETQANQDALKRLRYPYIVSSVSKLADLNLADYNVIVIASDQPTSTYNTLIANSDTLQNFVFNGGILVVHATDEGWQAGHWESSFLPGNVGHEHEVEESLMILAPNHPVVTGISKGGAISPDDLAHWNHSTHGYFVLSALPSKEAVTKVIGIDPSKPTYVEYTYGAGIVLATMQPIEWPWAGKNKALGERQKNLLINELEYACFLALVSLVCGEVPLLTEKRSSGSISVKLGADRRAP
jgi:hypothetical protein